MQSSKFIYSWLVLGPIYNGAEQKTDTAGPPWAAEIIWHIDDQNGTFKPADLTASVEQAPKPGDTATYGKTGTIYKPTNYQWRVLSFTDSTWENIHNIEDDIHLYLGPSRRDPKDSLSFAGIHHTLAFFLVYIYSQYARDTQLCVRSDDSIRVWFNGAEIEPLRFPAGERDAVKKNPELGERDIGVGPNQQSEETCANISLRQGYNILLAAVSETHVEWGFSARIEDAQCLKISPTPSGPCFDYRGDLPLR